MVEISFNVNSNNIISLDSVPVYSEAKFEKIYVVIDAYIEQSVVESSMLKLSVLSTEQGVFVSEHGDIYAYDNYISYLYSNSLISDQQYNLIQKRVTELSEIAADNGKAPETIPVKEVVRYYDMATDEVAIKSIDNFSELQRYVPQIETASISLMSTTTNGTIVAPSLTVSRTITSISNITNVADNTYSDLSFTNSDTTFSGWSMDYTTYSGYTDGNEAAVTCILLHLIIDNDIALSHQEVWNIAKASKCDSLSGFMKTLYSSVDKSLYSAIGTQLERQNIADAPNVKTSIFSRENPGTFYWTPAATRDNISDNNNYVYYNRATITFFDKNYNIVLQSPYISSALGTYGTPINDIQWKALNLSINSGDPFYWCISTSQNDNPGTGPYYSSLHKAYFSEDITTIANTNIQYSGYLNAYNDVVYKFVAPESGYYTFNSTGDTDVNVTLYTNTLLEGNSISNDDGGEGLNFLYDRYLLSGTTVYLKVGGYRSASGPFNIIAIRYTSTTVNTSKSMAINGTNGVWFRFVAPSNGSYTFYTTGDIDVYGELFSYPASNGSTNGRLTYNDDSGSGRNCLFTYDLSKNTVVYVRIRGYSSSITGNCCLCIAATPIVENLDTSYSGTLVANVFKPIVCKSSQSINFIHTLGYSNIIFAPSIIRKTSGKQFKAICS